MSDITIVDIAKRAGVSIKTVSRVINREGGVGPETRARIEDLVAELGYRPNVSARSLSSRRSYLIGVVFMRVGAYHYVGEVQVGAMRACRRAGYHMVIEQVEDERQARGPALDRALKAGRFDGLVLTPPMWKPSDTFSLMVNADYLHQGGAGGGDQTYGTARVTGDPWTCNCATNIYRNNRFFSTGAEANWDLGFANLTYLVGYNFSKLDRTGENASSGAPNYFLGKDYTWSHELRLGGDAGKLKWVVGLYRFTEDNNVDFRVFLATNSYLSFIQPEVTAESIAAFGQATYEVTDRFRVTGGLRYTEDKKGRKGGTFLTNGAGAIVSTVVANVADAKWDATNWKLGADFDLTSTSMLYANVATGYKAGGYYDGIADNVYAPEKITSYEAGVKNRFLDNRLQVNATAFLYDYRDFQVTALGTIGGQDAAVTLNADKAEVYGVEFETNLAITQRDRIDATLGWLHAEYKDFVLPRGDSFSNNNANAAVAACFTANYAQPAPRRTDFSGCRMARTPEWTLNLGYQHVWDLKVGGTLTGRIQTHYESDKNLEYHGFAQNREGAFTKTDVSLTYASADDRWTLQGYVRNLEDEAVRTASSPNSTTGLATNGAGEFYAPPRTYGLRLGVTF